ncbi:MAG: hypothetical protein KU37_05245 [Sulfuricurvum sp. PC08-66]|nr:MAG: hypothetical protein KU37_05245 [Sulfuricurvum sp. PC08-66]
MQAMIYETYGEPEVFHATLLKKPKQGRDELLVKIVATAVTTGDINMRGFVYVPHGLKWIARVMLGFKRPKKELIGHVFSGVVEAVGAGVKAFKVGDEVFGMESSGTGTYAHYKTIAHDKPVVLKPATVTHEEAASVLFGAMTALHFFQKAKLSAGQSVLINGASGSVGSAAVQIAKAWGMYVTAVCSTSHIDGVRNLGADEVIDYTQTDIHQEGKTYDVVLNTVVAQGDFDSFHTLLKPKGTYIAIAGGLKDMLRPLWGVLRGQKIVAGPSAETKELLEQIASMLIEGSLVPVVDPQVFPLEALAQAHRHAQSKARRGTVVVRVA